MTSTIIRIIITVTLIIMIWRETGPWTAVSIGLIFAALESTAHYLSLIIAELRRRSNNDIQDREEHTPAE